MGVFGDYISNKRQEKGFTLRGLAKKLGLSASYISDIEKGNREPNEKTLLDSLVKVLELNSEEAEKLYDMAAEQKNELAQDVSEYVNENSLAKVALRTAKTQCATDEDWKKFIEGLNNKK